MTFKTLRFQDCILFSQLLNELYISTNYKYIEEWELKVLRTTTTFNHVFTSREFTSLQLNWEFIGRGQEFFAVVLFGSSPCLPSAVITPLSLSF
jgi:hypothetical protein